ncbi:hypothetical protein HMPREF1548_01807 [Clostridium sp. KLE 1755]|nr:hypothetical protein HMPREF1548_01807 [Clostridium sp. KLE 1755]
MFTVRSAGPAGEKPFPHETASLTVPYFLPTFSQFIIYATIRSRMKITKC